MAQSLLMSGAMPPEDLGERTFRFACDAVQYCRELSKEPGVVRNVAWQLAEAATSAAANYQEAKAAYSRREFAANNGIVLKELRESKLWLRVVVTCELGQLDTPRRLLAEADELVAMFTTSMKRLHPVGKLLLGVLFVLVTCYLLLLTS
jgi:four helix bundle protein